MLFNATKQSWICITSIPRYRAPIANIDIIYNDLLSTITRIKHIGIPFSPVSSSYTYNFTGTILRDEQQHNIIAVYNCAVHKMCMAKNNGILFISTSEYEQPSITHVNMCKQFKVVKCLLSTPHMTYYFDINGNGLSNPKSIEQ